VGVNSGLDVFRSDERLVFRFTSRCPGQCCVRSTSRVR
jgi:hypothetical protein